MTCLRCQRESVDDSSFCRFCGAPFRSPVGETRRLTRLPSHGKLAGVCAGLAAYVKLDATVIRLGWVVLSIVPGALIGGLIAYCAAWLLIPESTETVVETPVDRLFRSETDRKVAGVCGGLARYLRVDSTLIRLAFVVMAIHPGVMFCGVLFYIVGWIVMPLEPPPHFEPATI